jgi:hypothetical protein
VGDPPRHVAVPAVRRRLIHRTTQTAAAVVAVIAVGVGGTAVAAHFAGGKRAPAAVAARGVPRYYLQADAAEPGQDAAPYQADEYPTSSAGAGTPVATRAKQALIRRTATGAITGHFRCPEGTGWWVNQAAALTNSTFIIGCSEQSAAHMPGTGPLQEVLLSVRLTAAGRVAGVSPVPGGHLTRIGAGVISMAAAPNGQEVALAISAGNGRMDIVVLNTATGQRALWRGRPHWKYWGLSLTSNGQELVFTGLPCLAVPRCTSAVSVLAVSPAAQGGSLAGARVIVPRRGWPSVAMISPDGSVLCSLGLEAEPRIPGSTAPLEYFAIFTCSSVKTGNLVGEGYLSRPDHGAAAVGFVTADPSGQYLIVHAITGRTSINGWIRENPATFNQDPGNMPPARLIPLKGNGAAIAIETW